MLCVFSYGNKISLLVYSFVFILPRIWGFLLIFESKSCFSILKRTLLCTDCKQTFCSSHHGTEREPFPITSHGHCWFVFQLTPTWCQLEHKSTCHVLQNQQHACPMEHWKLTWEAKICILYEEWAVNSRWTLINQEEINVVKMLLKPKNNLFIFISFLWF